MKELLVVIDMVNGFVNQGALADKKINKVTPVIEELIKKAIKKDIDIVAFKDCHEINDAEFKLFPPHCIKGSVESELIPELKKYQYNMININKNTTNGFITKQFQMLARAQDYDKVYVTGCCTDICVQSFVESYLEYIKENNKNTQINVIENACYTFDNQNHNAQEMHNKAIKEMQNKGAQIIKTKFKEKEYEGK